MADKHLRGGGRLTAATTATCFAAAVLGLGLSACGTNAPHAPTTQSTPAPQSTTTHPAPTPLGTPAPMPPSAPVRIAIARLGLDAPLIPVGRAQDGTVATPPFALPHTAGWYTGAVTPGQSGTAVIVGHVDTRTGPAVFYPLSLARPGDQVAVRRADHSTADFTIDTVRVIPRDDFDDTTIYAATGRPELRLITCGGTFDRTTQEYSSNVVVFAHLTARPTATTTTPSPDHHKKSATA
ncbi:hypothetical protein ABIA33_002854 [Streptacidiphilus sp. MAP12-16]|uniref:class F sortase n=1 Tax=Streptacidiphilus sp. MAP12-16 TaxID=3156300 RepID=UPI003517DCD4